MADRSDNEIKSDIISELEDLEYLDTGVSLLDAFVVERVHVAHGRADVLLVFDDDTDEADREAVIARVRTHTSDIEGLLLLVVDTTVRSALAAEEPTLVYPRPPGEAEARLLASVPPGAVPTEPVVAPRAAGAQLTLSSLLAVAVDGVPEEEFATPGLALGEAAAAAAADPGLSLYSGGGCGAGTALIGSDIAPELAAAPPVAAAARLEAPRPAAAAGHDAPRQTLALPTAAPTPPASDDAARQASRLAASVVVGDQVTISLQRYTELVRAEARMELLERLLGR